MNKTQKSPAAAKAAGQGWELKVGLCLVMLFVGLATTYFYFKPATEPNKVLMQHDIIQGLGMSKEIVDFRKAHNGEEPLWTSRLFGGMPAYQISTYYHGNLFQEIDGILKLQFLLPHPIGIMFLLFLGMFILLCALKVDPFTSAMGAMAFMLSTYFYTALEAGHNSKLNALAYTPMTLAGVLLAYRGRYLLGGAITAASMALAINANHIQTTYYGMFIVAAAIVSMLALSVSTVPRLVMLSLIASLFLEWAFLPSVIWKTTLILAIVAPLVAEYFMLTRSGGIKGGPVAFVRGRNLTGNAPKFRQAMLATAIIGAGFLLAVGPNVGRFWTNQDYVGDTMRGGMVRKNLRPEEKTERNDGLTKDYAYQWSYGVAETFTLINPFYYGDASTANVGKNSETYEILERSVGTQAADALSESWPTYIGDVAFTSGPAFVGAVVCFLFILGLLVVPDRYRWWLLVATMLGIFLSWGRNFQGFSDLFFDNLPLYNKFRAVSMMLMIAEVTMPILAALAVAWFISNPNNRSQKDQFIRLGIAAGATVLLLLVLMVLAPGTDGYTHGADQTRITRMLMQVGLRKPDPGLVAQLMEALPGDRRALMTSAALKGILYILLAAGLLFVSVKYIKPAAWKTSGGIIVKAIAGLGILMLVMVEMIPVNKRYISEKNFVTKMEYNKNLQPSTADQSILQDPDPNYRVLNLTRDPWQDAMTSYHHKSVGGYHAAKFRRYNDLIQLHLMREQDAIINALGGGPEAINMLQAAFQASPALRMMNVKYIIYNPSAPALPNPARMGNAWVVDNYQVAASTTESESDADVAIGMLGKVDLAKTMVVEREFESALQGFTPAPDTNATITLASFQPNAVSYTYNAPSGKEQLVVFSEVYYNSGKGWKAYLDGQPVEHFRCNYVLRGMRVPGGPHKIEFKFEPKSYATGETMSLTFSILLLLGIGAAVFFDVRKQFAAPKDTPEEADLE